MTGGSNGRETRSHRRGLPWLGACRTPSAPDGWVFISYRRGDSAGHTGRLYDGLSAAFGDEAIFMDIDTIDPGVAFAQRIREAWRAAVSSWSSSDPGGSTRPGTTAPAAWTIRRTTCGWRSPRRSSGTAPW